MAGSEQEGVEGADADLFEGAVWVLTPTASDRRRRVRVGAIDRVVARRRRRRAAAGAARRAGRRRLTRTAPDGRDADAPRRRARRGTPGVAAARRGRVPRHDPHRRRPSGHLARHLRREPRRDRRDARSAHRGAQRHARRRGQVRPRRAARRARTRRSSPAATCRHVSRDPISCARCGCPCRTAPACSPTSRRWPPSST